MTGDEHGRPADDRSSLAFGFGFAGLGCAIALYT
jgi:hypothetical protein